MGTDRKSFWPYLDTHGLPEALDWTNRIVSARSSFLAWFRLVLRKTLKSVRHRVKSDRVGTDRVGTDRVEVLATLQQVGQNRAGTVTRSTQLARNAFRPSCSWTGPARPGTAIPCPNGLVCFLVMFTMHGNI